MSTTKYKNKIFKVLHVNTFTQRKVHMLKY